MTILAISKENILDSFYALHQIVIFDPYELYRMVLSKPPNASNYRPGSDIQCGRQFLNGTRLPDNLDQQPRF